MGNAMIRNMVSNLALTVMLVHALLGCCWHHLHACESNLAGAGPAIVANDADNHEYDHSDQSSHAHQSVVTHQSDEHHDQPICDTGKCRFVTSSKVKAPLSFTQPTSVDLLSAASTSPLLSRSRQLGRHWPVQSAFPRLQELTQVWLL